MGIFDRAKEALGDGPDRADVAIDRSADAADRRTGENDDARIGPDTDRAEDQRGERTPADRPTSEPPA